MRKTLILAAIVASIATVPTLAAAKGGHSFKAPKALKAQTTKAAPAKKG